MIVMLISLFMVAVAVYFAVQKNRQQTAVSDQGGDVHLSGDQKNSQVIVNDPEPPEPEQPEKPSGEGESSASPDLPTQAEVPSIEFGWPCESMNIGQEYSGLVPVYSETLRDWRAHTAVDIVTEKAENVYAAADGVVEDVYTDGLMGNTVLIKHSDSLYTLYQSLEDNPKVLKNMEVKKGDLIGKTSASASAEESVGVHLHFAVIENGNNCDPLSKVNGKPNEGASAE